MSLIEIEKKIEYERQIIQDHNQFFGNVLLISISKKVPHIKALKKAASKLSSEIKVHGGDTDINCIGRYFVDKFWEMPPLEELTIKILLDYCKDHNIVAIIPTRDGELSFLSRIKSKLKEHGINIMLSDKKTVGICLDKLQFYRSSLSFSDNVIPTYVSAKEVQSYHLVVKERYGSGSEGIGIKLVRDEAVTHSLQLQNPVFQPYIEGKEVSVDCYIDNKKNIKGIIMRSRDKVINGESQITTTFHNERLYLLCGAFIKNYNFYGHVILQIIQNQDKYHIIEVNARIGGASTLSFQIGLDSLYWFLLEANNQDLSRYVLDIDKTKIFKQVRYPADEILVIQ
jgi:carbamoyl-phosphate synthase large subunit